MGDLRFDIPPLPIAELAPIRFESTDPAEPFVLGSGATRVTGNCRPDLIALRRDGAESSGEVTELRAVITPCGVVRTARIDGVVVTERVAVSARPAAIVTQWSVDADAELVLARLGTCRLLAGQTATAVPLSVDGTDIAHGFRAAAGRLADAIRAGLHLEGGDAGCAALAWAKARLWTDASPHVPGSLAALVAGRPAPLRAHLHDAARDLFPLLAARYAASTGDLQGVASCRHRFLTPDRPPGTPPPDEARAALWLAGLAEFQRTAVDLGEPGHAADLHSLAKHARAALAGRLPSDRTAAILTALRAPLAEPSAPGWTETDDVARHAWQTWAALEHGRLAAGFDGWRRLLAEAQSPVRGAWPDRFGSTADSAEAAALFVLTLAHGLLGIAPDAPRHRIRIAPRLAARPASFAARGIPCGDATVSLIVDVDERAIALRLAQDTGAIPLTALLEPVIEGGVAAMFIDGRPAGLDVRPHGEGTVVPVQIVLDTDRTLCIERARRG